MSSERLSTLFEAGATLVIGKEPPTRSSEAIACMALATWSGDHPYVAAPQRVLVARNLALIITEQGITVVRRDHDGAWRYTIVLQTVGENNE